MKRSIIGITCIVLLCVSSIAAAQNQLELRAFDPKIDPDIDLFISDWRESVAEVSYGALIERVILTPCEGDPINPAKRGAVLEYLNRFSYAMLQKNKSTTPSTPDGEQIVFYIVSGKGSIRAGSKTVQLHPGVLVLVPEGLEFTMTNTGDESLIMYLISEPVPAGFTPSTELVVKDENTIPISTTKSHWSHILRPLLYRTDVLATLIGLSPVWFDPMTLGQPHSHGENSEEIWFVVEGEVVLHLGKELRRLKPGMAYKIPPNGTTPHSNINVSDEQIKLFWFMVVKQDGE